MPRKTFASKIRPELFADPLEIELTGYHLSDRSPWSAVFTCRPTIPVDVLDKIGTRPDDGMSIVALVQSALNEESAARFEEVVRDPDRLVTLQDLVEITEYLTEELTGRPTRR